MTLGAKESNFPESSDNFNPPVQDATVHELHPMPEVVDQFPAVTAFREFCNENALYPKVGPNVQARMRPGLVLAFTRAAITRRSAALNDPTIKPILNEATVKRNIEQIQMNYGVTPPAGAQQQKTRFDRISAGMQRAMLHKTIPDINAAYAFYSQVIAAEDQELIDSTELLIAASGMSLDTTVRPV